MAAPAAPAVQAAAQPVAAVVSSSRNGDGTSFDGAEFDAAEFDAADPGGDSGGLPRRAPGEHLPDLGPRRDETDAPLRDEVDVAAQLSGFQDGVERARAHVGQVDGDNDTIDDTSEETPDDVSDDASDEAAAELTEGGLERRKAGSHLPDTGPPRDPSATTPPRNPEDVRSALTSFQYGVARGTLERPDPLNGEEPS
jgi:hypothetical protein